MPRRRRQTLIARIGRLDTTIRNMVPRAASSLPSTISGGVMQVVSIRIQGLGLLPADASCRHRRHDEDQHQKFQDATNM